MGHEIAGELIGGSQGTPLQPGQRVVVDPVLYCGACGHCRAGRTNLCPHRGVIGREVNGGFADYLVAPASHVYPLPESIDDRTAPLIQVLTTCLHAQRRAGVGAGQSVAVAGLGVSGQLHVQLAKARGAYPVIGISRSAWKRQLAEELGADITVTPGKEAIEVTSMATSGQDADVVIESTGVLRSLADSIAIVRPGGTVLLFGIYTATEGALPFYQLYFKEPTLMSARAATSRDFPESIDLVAQGAIRLSPLVTQVVPLSELRRALEMLSNDVDGRMKIILETRLTQPAERLVAGADKGDYRSYGLWIDGHEVAAAAGLVFDVENPANQEIIARVAEGRAEDVDRAVEAARRAFGDWGKTSGAERFHLLCRLGEVIRDHASDLARWETLATGRPIREMIAQVQRLSDFFEYFAATARVAEGEVTPFAGPYLNYTRHVPLGVIGLITPWNHPLLILTKKLAPALAAGNTVVIKPSEFTPTTTLELARLCKEAGIPDGVVNVVPGFGATAGKRVATHPAIQKVDLTGGGEAGAIVGAQAASHYAQVAMELGGNTPIIIFEDADLKEAASGAAFAAYIAAGQSCVQGARLIVHERMYDAFAHELVARAKRIRVGDPLDPETQMGPVASCKQYDRVLAYIDKGVSEGARLVAGGRAITKAPLDRGYHIEPTIFADVTPDMTIARQEIFGPVTTLMRFATEEQAIAIANDSRFGLGAAIWTRDIARAHRVAHALESGVIWINDHHRIDPAMPWGGFKDSSTGREAGLQAYRSFTQTQTVVVKLTDEPFDWYNGCGRYS